MHKNGISMEELSVGYGKKVVIDDITLSVEPGRILTLIGPNGSGKSTILKTITGSLKELGGTVYIQERNKNDLSGSDLAKVMSMVMTERLHPELMSCRDVVATGRYPYTGRLGILTREDWQKVDTAIEMLNASEIAGMPFAKVSDGQRQRVMLARALCQEPQILILDEPTSFLDMRYKLEILTSIRRMVLENQLAVVMSLHELDLAAKISDTIACVSSSGHIEKVGTPAEIYQGDFIQRLFGVPKEAFDPKTGEMFLPKVAPVGTKDSVRTEQETARTEGAGEHRAKVLMVQGTMSNAGKSLIVAGLCRIFKQDGYRVAPFKSQNMALNSFITKDGFEMGRAQVMQAEAAGILPDVAMNPILLKPTGDIGSQVIVNGKSIGNMKAKDYFAYKTNLIPEIQAAFRKLEEQNDIIVIEGAGSPAEINLKSQDIVNMGLAKMVGAPVLLVGNIDPGGVFAQLLGTQLLLEEDEKALVKGLIINKFRGDKTILDPGITMLEEKAGVPVVGVIPYMQLQVDDEDSLSSRLQAKAPGLVTIAVVHLPRISNFTDFNAFERIPGVSVSYVKSPSELADADLVILPGSKNTLADLRWLRESGMEAAVHKFSEHGPVFGICGGYQMLGESISDPYGVEEDEPGELRGLGLLPVITVLSKEKETAQVEGTMPVLDGVLAGLSGRKFEGYEIHMGQTTQGTELAGVVVQRDHVYGSYVHGLFDAEGIAEDICKALAERKGIVLEGAKTMSMADFKNSQYDLLAAQMREHMDMEAVYGMLRESLI